MNGFTQSAIWEKKDGENELTMWAPEKIPIMTTLAKEFALFDRWFGS
jgi:phospholipase C